jgi:hypothetical protein
MNKINEEIVENLIDIPENASFGAITLYVDSASAGQTSAVWDLTKENCLSFANNQDRGCAYTKNGKIFVENVIAYIVFFN